MHVCSVCTLFKKGVCITLFGILEWEGVCKTPFGVLVQPFTPCSSEGGLLYSWGNWVTPTGCRRYFQRKWKWTILYTEITLNFHLTIWSRSPLWKIQTILIAQRKPSRATININAFHCQQRWMEHTGKSLKDTLHVLWAPLGLKQRQAVKNQACSLNRYLRNYAWQKVSGRQSVDRSVSQSVGWLVSRSGSQSEENSFKYTFCGNFLKALRVDLKPFMVLVLPNHYYPLFFWKIEAK